MKKKKIVDNSRELVASRTTKRDKDEVSTPPSAKVPDALLQKFQKQGKEIDEFANKFIAEHESPTKVKKKSTAKKPIKILIEMESPGHEIIGMPRRLKTTPQEVYSAFGVACFTDATSAFLSARTALREGRIEDFYQHLFSTERSLGAANAWSSVDKIISTLASVKADAGHKARTYALRKRVLDFWHKRIDPTISANKAAEMINERYLSKTGEEVGFRTLAKWISEEKKQGTRSAQTPNPLPPDAPAGRLINPKAPRRSWLHL